MARWTALVIPPDRSLTQDECDALDGDVTDISFTIVDVGPPKLWRMDGPEEELRKCLDRLGWHVVSGPTPMEPASKPNPVMLRYGSVAEAQAEVDRLQAEVAQAREKIRYVSAALDEMANNLTEQVAAHGKRIGELKAQLDDLRRRKDSR